MSVREKCKDQNRYLDKIYLSTRPLWVPAQLTGWMGQMQPCDPNLTPVAACLSKLFVSLPAFLSVLHCASNKSEKAPHKTSPLQQNWLELQLSVSVWLNFKGEDPIKRYLYHSTYEQWRSEVWWSSLTDCDSRLCVADVFLFYLNY